MNETTSNSAVTAQRAEEGAEQSPEGQSTEPEGQSTETGQPTGPQKGLWSRVFGKFGRRNVTTIREDLEDALSGRDTDSTAFSPGERAMLNNILRLRELRVEDVMVPRADINAVDISTTLGDLLLRFEDTGHSRMPVFQDTLDDARGMVHIRDVMGYLTKVARRKPRVRKQPAKGGEITVVAAPQPAGEIELSRVDLKKTIAETGIMRSLLFVPPSMHASDLMTRMQAGRIQMALVIDEYGGTDGLVSLEDIVEMVVGDIEDEHDEEDPLITKVSEGVYVVDAKAEIDDVAEMIGNGFTAGIHAEDVDTIGGMIFNTLGRIPARGEVVQPIPGYEFQVLDADPRRVKRVRIVQGRSSERRRRVQQRSGIKPTQEAAE
jgi:CBS domain containing-hemolysin-like protein